MSLDIYEKKCVIGKGSYGEVWLVRHKKDKKQYVLKKMELLNASKREKKAAEQEGKLLSKLKHPNIVSYKDSFECESGFLYIAMGYCEGGDLYSRLKEQKGSLLEERQVVEWFVQITMALQYMHERNILHRDLKTQNIFLTKSKIIKVGDLGIARVLDSSSDMATTLIGTPYYMSPELFSNKPYNHRSDVWALGCCVYEMTTLKHAFNAKDMNSLVYKILRGKMPAMPKSYSTELVTLIKAMLNHNPDKRPSVNRILRDPYIKKNIAIFLEGTKKSRRPSSSRGRPSSGDISSRRSSQSSEADLPDSARSSASSVSGVAKAYDRSRLSPAVDEKLDPLQVAPDLHPIQEEQTPRDNLDESGESRKSSSSSVSNRPLPVKVFKDHSSPSQPRVEDQVNARQKKRKFLSEAAAKPIVINLKRVSPTPNQNSPSNHKRTPSGDSHTSPGRGSELRKHSKERDSSKSPARAQDKGRAHSKSPNRKRGSKEEYVGSEVRQASPSSQQPRPSANSSSSRKNSSSSSSNYAGKGEGSQVSKAPKIRLCPPLQVREQPVQPRPLPPRPSSGSAEPSAAVQKKSRAVRGNGERESGYGSSSVTSSASSSRDNDPTSARSEVSSEETPRGLNLSARARRREKKESETPRTSRSVDIDRSRRLQEVGDSRPSTAGNAGRALAGRDGGVDQVDSRLVPARASADAVLSRPYYPSQEPPHQGNAPNLKPRPQESRRERERKQPSVGEEDSSSSSEGEENVAEDKVDNREKRRDVTQPDDPEVKGKSRPDSGSKVKGQANGKKSPQGESSESDDDDMRKEKEMNNFISLLDTTLRMNKPEEKSDSDDDVVIVTPGTQSTAPPSEPPELGEILVPVKEVESVSSRPQHPTEAAPLPEAAHMAAGRTLTTTGRLWERITHLRKDCIRGLGVQKLKQAFDILDNFEADELEPQLIAILGKRDFDLYAGKVWQLKFCEEAAFGLM